MFKKKTIPIGRYCNHEELIGYTEDHSVFGSGAVLYPYLSEHDKILNSLDSFGGKEILVKQTPVRMPYDRMRDLSIEDYSIGMDLVSLETTLVTTWLIRKDHIDSVRSDFTIDNQGLHLLSDYAKNVDRGSYITNGGYFVTPNLLYQTSKSKPWNWEKRFGTQYSLPEGLSPFYGFYYVRKSGRVYSTFQDFPNRGHVIITQDGQIELRDSLKPQGYRVWIDNREIDLNSVAVTLPSDNTPTSQKIQAQIEASSWQDSSWQTYAEIVEKPGTHLMIMNQGQGTYPQDKVVAVWRDKHPIPNTGYVMSFPEEISIDIRVGSPVRVEPVLPEDIADAQAIYALGVPLVENGKNSLNGKNGETLMKSLRMTGLTHPNFQLSQESIVLSPYVRVPSHILIETDSYIGGILCNGRYEYSLGASLLDEIHLLKLLQEEKVLPENIITAIKADGGSGAKIAQVTSTGLRFGNIPAPGVRNDFGDGDSNFYHGIVFETKNATRK